jgi:hypothetical protein
MHKRSYRKLEARKARSIILRNSFYDRKRSEVVSKLSRSDVLTMFSGFVEADFVPNIEKGEVLMDSRGNGSLQKSGEDGF